MLEKVVRYIRSRGVRVGGTEAMFITSPHGSLAVACLSEEVVHVCVGMCNLYAWCEAVIVAVCVLNDGRTALKGPCAMSDTFMNGMDGIIWRVTAITLLVTEGVLS
jgi:hypothetical protein